MIHNKHGLNQRPIQPDSSDCLGSLSSLRSLASQVLVYDELLTAEECGAIIAKAESLGLNKQQYSTGPAAASRDRIGFENKVWAGSIWERIQDRLPNLNSFCIDKQFSDPAPAFPLGEYKPSGLNPFLRVYRYQTGSRFAPHEDAPYVVSNSDRSFLTALVYLNEDFSGGGTIFYADRLDPNAETLSITPKIGSLIIFQHELWHEGAVVQGGSKCVLRTEVMYSRQSQSGT